MLTVLFKNRYSKKVWTEYTETNNHKHCLQFVGTN